MVGSGPGDHESRPLRVSDEAEGIPGGAEACLHLGAHRDIFHVPAQGVGEESVQGVPAVPADILAEKSGADSDADLFHILMIAYSVPKENQSPAAAARFFTSRRASCPRAEGVLEMEQSS